LSSSLYIYFPCIFQRD